MRRRVPVVALPLVAGLCAALVAFAELRAADQGSPLGAPLAATPVLSVRRVPTALATPVALEDLRADLAAWARRAAPSSCASVVTVSGEPLLDLRAGELRVPASTLKIVTATLALDLLGPEHVVAGRGTTVTQLLGPLLGDSDNGVATALYDEVRRSSPGSTVPQLLARLDVDLTGAVVADGTGRSRANRLACRHLTDLLRRVGTGRVVQEQLPVAGRSGTLADVFVGTPLEGALRAKTGSLGTASALAGTVEDADGVFLFAYVVNWAPGDEIDHDAVLAQQLELGRTLLDWSPDTLTEQVGPLEAAG